MNSMSLQPTGFQPPAFRELGCVICFNGKAIKETDPLRYFHDECLNGWLDSAFGMSVAHRATSTAAGFLKFSRILSDWTIHVVAQTAITQIHSSPVKLPPLKALIAIRATVRNTGLLVAQDLILKSIWEESQGKTLKPEICWAFNTKVQQRVQQDIQDFTFP